MTKLEENIKNVNVEEEKNAAAQTKQEAIVDSSVDFVVDRKVFWGATNRAMKAVDQKSSINALTMLKLTVSNDWVMLTGSDSNITVQALVISNGQNLKVETEGSVLVPATTLDKAVSAMNGSKIHVAMSGESGESGILIEDENSHLVLPIMDAKMYPKVDKELSEIGVINAADFGMAIESTAYASSVNEDNVHALQAVKLTFDDDKATFVATDSRRLAETSVPFTWAESSSKDECRTILLPAAMLKKAIKMFNIKNGGEAITVSLAEDENKIDLRQGKHIHISVRALSGNYPETNRLWEATKDPIASFTVDRSQMRMALNRMFLISDSTRGCTVRATVSASGFEMRALSPGVGKLTEHVDVSDAAGDQFKIAFNPHYLDDALATMPEKATIHFVGVMRPFTVDAEGTRTKCLLTPIRTLGDEK